MTRLLDLLSTPPAEAAVWLLFRATHTPMPRSGQAGTGTPTLPSP